MAESLQPTAAGFVKKLSEEIAMRFLRILVSSGLALISTLLLPCSAVATALRRSDPVLVRAVLDGDTIDVATFGRVRLLGIDAPEIGRGFDTANKFLPDALSMADAFTTLSGDEKRFDC